MMILKCYPQYASKFGKLSSGHRTGKSQFSFQSQRKTMPKNVQITEQLQSHVSKVMFKIFQARLQQNREFPDVPVGFRKSEKLEIKLPTSFGSYKMQENSRKTSILLHWLL